MRTSLSVVLSLILLISTAGIAVAETVRVLPEEPVGTWDNPAPFGTTIQYGSLEITLDSMSGEGEWLTINFRVKNNRAVRTLGIGAGQIRPRNSDQSDFCDVYQAKYSLKFKDGDDARSIELAPGSEYEAVFSCWSMGSATYSEENVFFVTYQVGEDDPIAAWQR
jgi:hypothetical protein